MGEGNHSLLYQFSQKYIWAQEVNDGQPKNFDIVFTFCTTVEISLLIAVSHFLHFFLKRSGQPSTVSHMLAGFLLGPTVIGKFNLLNEDKWQLEAFASGACIFFMLLVGLEVDIMYLCHTFHPALLITLGSALTCFPISLILSTILYSKIHSSGNVRIFATTIFLIFFNTASPVLIRVVHELKLAMTETGKLAISAALLNDIVCLVILGLLGVSSGQQIRYSGGGAAGLLALVLAAGTALALRLGITLVNKHNSHRATVGDDVVLYLLLPVLVVSVIMDFLGYDAMIVAFLFGLAIPRDGPTRRTIIEQLTYLVYNFFLPVFFGAAGLKVDFSMLRQTDVILMTLMVIFVGTVGKIGGTMVVARYLGLRMGEMLVLSFLLNVRGHVDLMVITLGLNAGVWSKRTHIALLVALFFNSIIACPAITHIVRRDRQANQYYMYKGLEWLNAEGDLSILTCIHSPSDVPTILNLIEISSSSNKRSLTPHILYLKELTRSAAATVLYHQLQDGHHDNELCGNQAQINVAVDAFIKETEIHLHQRTAMSRVDSMHEDVQHAVEDTQASLAIVPFHRKRKLDGKMGVGKQEMRQFNINVLTHVPCSVGILVDRGMGREQKGSISSEESMQIHVVVLFLGGPDDREAASYGGRLTLHPSVNVTFVRFKHRFLQGSRVYHRGTSVSSESSSVLMEIEGEDADEIFMANFYNRFVVGGSITYDERVVENSAELIGELRSMKRMYSLYIVGRQVQGPSTKLMEGISEWVECPELGSIGDLLVSSDFMLDGSVLVIQQYNENHCNILANSL